MEDDIRARFSIHIMLFVLIIYLAFPSDLSGLRGLVVTLFKELLQNLDRLKNYEELLVRTETLT